MRLKQAEVQENRKKILDTAGRLFRKRGFDGVGVADLMAAAGFTHGGFYNHFPSKEALASAAAADSLGRSHRDLGSELERGGRRALRGYLGRYLSPGHRDHPEAGCTLAALSADAGRQGTEVQSSFASGLREALSLVTGVLAGRGGKRRLELAREEALRTYSEIVGALVLSRAVKDADPALSEEILAASRKALG
ncbi:MAG TPA: TetR/AcrR family transcriptional regulator [Myxococcaceae bacterium]|nr:TetR/AcrR family transcriptional regulator [Myxococcaceae bacterium]